MGLHALPDTEWMLKDRGVRKRAGLQSLAESSVLDAQVEFLPTIFDSFQDTAWEGVHKLIGKKAGTPVRGLQSGGERLVPCHSQAAQQFSLGLAKWTRDFHDVVAYAAAFPPAK